LKVTIAPFITKIQRKLL